MATITVSADTNYSALVPAANDDIVIDSGAVLTVDTSTIDIRRWECTTYGTLQLTNASTTTPIFVHVGSTGTVPRIRMENGGQLISSGALILVGTSNGTANQTFNLPQDAGLNNYDQLAGVWVNHGDTFRDATPFNRTYTRVDSFADAFGDDRFGLFFTHDTGANTITFGDGTNGFIPPNGAAIYVPNIQIKNTSTSTDPTFDMNEYGRTTLTSTSIAGPFNLNFQYGSGHTWTNVCAGNSTAIINFQYQADSVNMTNVALVGARKLYLNNAPTGHTLKNVFLRNEYTANDYGLEAVNTVEGYYEFVTVMDTEKTAGNSGRGAIGISGRGHRLYDLACASTTCGVYATAGTTDCLVQDSMFNYGGKRSTASATAVPMVRVSNSSRVIFKNCSLLPLADGGRSYIESFIWVHGSSSDCALVDSTLEAGGLTNHVVTDWGADTVIANLTVTGQLTNRVADVFATSNRLKLKNIQLADVQANTTSIQFGRGAEYDQVAVKGTNNNNAEGTGTDAVSGLVHMDEVYNEARLIMRMSPDVDAGYYTPVNQTGEITFPQNNRMYIENSGDIVELESRVHGGITGVTGEGQGGASNAQYDVEVAMRRENGVYTAYLPLTTANAATQLASLAADPDNKVQCKFRVTKNTTSTTAYLNRIHIDFNVDTGYAAPVVLNPVDVLVTNGVDGSHLRMTAAAGGPLALGTVIHQDFFDATGIISFSHEYDGDQPIEGWIRKGSASTFYKQFDLLGTITINGLTIIANQEPDE